MIPDREKRPVTVEDLLKIKRSERPRDEFWNGWQAEMRARLNEARQQPRPWYKDFFHRVGIGIARQQMAVGVSCMLALGFVLLHDSRPSFSPLPGELPGAELRLSPVAKVVSVPAPVVAEPQQRVALDRSQPASFSEARQTREASTAITRLERPEGPSPAALAIAANLAAVAAVDPDLSPRYSFGDVFEVPERGTTERVVRESRSDNLLGYSYAPSVAAESNTQSRRQDRLLSRLSEDALSESAARRLGGSRGDRLSLRF
jgi:hypothetical protein